MIDNKDYLKKLGFEGEEISSLNFLINPSWQLYWDDPSGPKDVPHQAKTLIFPESKFPKYEEMNRIPGSFLLFADDLEKDGEYVGKEKEQYNKAKDKGYYIIGKNWGHNAHRDRTEEFCPILLKAIVNAK